MQNKFSSSRVTLGHSELQNKCMKRHIEHYKSLTSVLINLLAITISKGYPGLQIYTKKNLTSAGTGSKKRKYKYISPSALHSVALLHCTTLCYIVTLLHGMT